MKSTKRRHYHRRDQRLPPSPRVPCVDHLIAMSPPQASSKKKEKKLMERGHHTQTDTRHTRRERKDAPYDIDNAALDFHTHSHFHQPPSSSSSSFSSSCFLSPNPAQPENDAAFKDDQHQCKHPLPPLVSTQGLRLPQTFLLLFPPPLLRASTAAREEGERMGWSMP